MKAPRKDQKRDKRHNKPQRDDRRAQRDAPDTKTPITRSQDDTKHVAKPKNAEKAVDYKNLEANSKLYRIFSSEDRKKLVAQFIESATDADIEAEAKYLSALITAEKFGLEFSLFVCETSALCHYNYSLVKAIYRLLDYKRSHRYSVYRLRLLQCLQIFNEKRLVPISSYLVEIIQHTSVQPVEGSAKRVDMECLKVSADSFTREFNDFVLGKALKLLFKHLNTFSDSIAFPELVFFILKKLGKLGKRGELTGLITKVQDQSKYIEEERKRLPGTLDAKSLASFGKCVKKMAEKAS